MKPYHKDTITKHIAPLIASIDYKLLKYKLGDAGYNELMQVLHKVHRDKLIDEDKPETAKLVQIQIDKYGKVNQ